MRYGTLDTLSLVKLLTETVFFDRKLAITRLFVKILIQLFCRELIQNVRRPLEPKNPYSLDYL